MRWRAARGALLTWQRSFAVNHVDDLRGWLDDLQPKVRRGGAVRLAADVAPPQSKAGEAHSARDDDDAHLERGGSGQCVCVSGVAQLVHQTVCC